MSAKIFRQIWAHKLGRIGLIITIIILLVGIFGEQIAPYDAHARVGRPFSRPSRDHWLGLNDFGQDILSELIVGTRTSLFMGVTAALIAVAIGSIVGITAGYLGGKVDMVLMRIVDFIMVLPTLPLMILMAAFWGSSFWNIIIVIGLLSWTACARTVRAQVLTLKNKGYIQATQVMGGSPSYIMYKHIVPPTFSIIVSQLILLSSRAILTEATMSFLGLGDPTNKSWGIILYYAQSKSAFLTGTWVNWILPPGFAIAILVMAFAYLGNAIEEVVNPRLKGRDS